MTEKTLDVAVIGAGPGGYVCAIRAAQLGLKTALIERSPDLGGTCLNVGCIPSKALLHSTELFSRTKLHGAEHGMRIDNISIDLATLMARKNDIVHKLRRGVETIVRKRDVAIVYGEAELHPGGAVQVTGDEGVELLHAEHTVIATGSKAAELPNLRIDGKTVVSSDHAIAFERVPPRLVVVGGGAIGLELGAVWNRLGSQVTIIEFLPMIAPTFDPEISAQAARIFKRQGLRIETSSSVTEVTERDGKTIVRVEQKGIPGEFETDKVLLAVGRIPCSRKLGLEKVGVEVTDRGFIRIDDHFSTTVPGVYAIGDVVEGPMLAHKAEEEGVAVAEIIAGHPGEVNYEVIPNVIYTDPELAGVGLTETAATANGLDVRTGSFRLSANSRAVATGDIEGIVKITADADSDRILGVQILAPNASELIATAVTHMEYGGSAEDLARTVHAHPTISESLKEAALAVDGRAIHSL